MSDQRSLTDQLTDTARLAEAAGMYDAADFIWKALPTVDDPEWRECQGCGKWHWPTCPIGLTT